VRSAWATRTLRALRALLRVEARGMRRNAGRSWLVILLVAVPVAAMVGGSTMLATSQRTPDEARAQVLGAAHLRVESGSSLAELRALLPAGALVERVSVSVEELRAPGRRLSARSFEIDAAALEPQGLARGLLRITGGRAPSSADEVAVSPVLLDGLRRSVGDTVELAGDTLRVTGVVVDPESLEMPVVLRAPHPADPRGSSAFLVGVVDDDPGIVAQRLRAAGQRVITRTELGQPDEFDTIAIFVLGGFGFFEAALIISAAFAVGMRRRQREIGLLGATGAAIGHMRASFLAAALALASLGAAIGVVVGIGAALALHPFFDRWNLRWNGDLELSARHVVGAVVLGLVAAAAAAILPAFGATRLPIRVALSGRRPVTEGTRAWFVLGIVLVASGLGLVVWGSGREGGSAGASILGGSILAVLGLGACSPWLLGVLARVAAPLPLAWRLAARDAGRFRARNGPVVAAVLAGMSISVMLASLIGSIETLIVAKTANLRGDQLAVDGPEAEAVARSLAEELSAVAVAPLAAFRLRGDLVHVKLAGVGDARATDAWIASGEEGALSAFGASAGLEALRSGRLVALVDRATASESRAASVTLVVADDRPLVDVDVAWIEVDELARAPTFFAGADLAQRLGLETGPPPRSTLTPWMLRLESVVTRPVLERAQDRAAASTGTSIDAAMMQRQATGPILFVVLLLCFVTGIVVVFVATTLSSVESAADAHVLRSVGAAPSLLRTHVAARAGYLALMGCVLAIPAGLLPSYGIVELANADLRFAMPWTEIAIVVLGMPALAFGGAWLGAAFERPFARLRVARG